MYNVEIIGEQVTIDYNYEPVILDLFTYVNQKKNIQETIKSADGTDVYRRDEMEKYLRNKYGIILDDLPNDYIYIGEYGYSLYSMDGEVYYENGGAHAMIVTDYTEDGKKIVSSWGGKYVFENGKGLFSYLHSWGHKKTYNGRKDNN